MEVLSRYHTGRDSADNPDYQLGLINSLWSWYIDYSFPLNTPDGEFEVEFGDSFHVVPSLVPGGLIEMCWRNKFSQEQKTIARLLHNVPSREKAQSKCQNHVACCGFLWFTVETLMNWSQDSNCPNVRYQLNKIPCKIVCDFQKWKIQIQIGMHTAP